MALACWRKRKHVQEVSAKESWDWVSFRMELAVETVVACKLFDSLLVGIASEQGVRRTPSRVDTPCSK